MERAIALPYTIEEVGSSLIERVKSSILFSKVVLYTKAVVIICAFGTLSKYIV